MLKLYKGLGSYLKEIALLVLCLVVQSFALLLLPNMMSNIIDQGVITGDIDFIVHRGLLMLLIALGGSASAIGVGYLASKIGVSFCTDVRKKLFCHVDKFTMSEFDKVGPSSLTTRSTNDVLQIQNFTIMMFRVIILAPIMCAGGIILSVEKNPQLALVLVVCMPIILLFLVIIMKRAFPVFRSMQKKLDRVNQVVRENITGVRVIRAFTAEQREEDRFDTANEDMTATSKKSQIMISTLMPLMMLIINLGTVAVVWFGGQLISDGALMVGDLMAFIQYLMLIMYALVMMSLIFAMMPRASTCADRINEVLDIEPDIVEPQNAKKPERQTGVVEFCDVELNYDQSGKPAVSSISFTARPGETTALIGATGSGKSSIVSLIPRLRDVTGGAVLVDGVDVREYDLDSLRSRIGFVPQNSSLFSGTIHSNIAYHNQNLPMEKVEQAAKIAQADTFIQKKKHKYDDLIAQGGTNVSGGQRQRLTIARAIASEAGILVFDDSFSALDFKTDAALRKAIKESNKDATLIIVAQRVNTIMNAEKIIVLDKGRIVGEGTHNELLKSCDVYAEIANTQLA